jgi:hypothetical protein
MLALESPGSLDSATLTRSCHQNAFQARSRPPWRRLSGAPEGHWSQLAGTAQEFRQIFFKFTRPASKPEARNKARRRLSRSFLARRLEVARTSPLTDIGTKLGGFLVRQILRFFGLTSTCSIASPSAEAVPQKPLDRNNIGRR